ncbi:MAG: PAC2 family protein [Candidatus Auribacterota bacterium]|nr:PAC2 family protein [Candidatus Auribacterota bacterium]
MITYLKHPRLEYPQLLVAWPGMGYVASKTVSYLVDALQAERFAFINPGDYFSPTSVVVENSLAEIPPLPSSNFYFWKNPYSGSDLILFQGDAQPSPSLQIKMAREVIGLAAMMGVFRFWTFAAAPAAIQHKDKPRIWSVANTMVLRDYLVEHGVELLEMGHISGLNGLLLGTETPGKIPGICLLGEIPYYTVNLENPRASLAIIHLLEILLSIRIDLLPLQDEVKKYDKEITRIGKKAQETMETFIHQNDGLMGLEGLMGDDEEEEEEDEEDRPLPEPARKRIEELFRQVRQDPLQAAALKEELDKWGVYHLYEDRFLDLFREGEAG